jgi:uncharacterized protein (TIRG00374 family)
MTLNVATKNVFFFIARVALSAALLIYLFFFRIDFHKTVETVRTAQVNFLVYGGIIFFVINVILLFRWLIFIRAIDVVSPFRDVIRYYFIGLFGNLFLPSSIGGDFLKIYGLCRNSSQKTRIIASVLLDRLSGFVAIALVAVITFVLNYYLFDNGLIIFLISIMVVISVTFTLLLFNKKMYSFGCRIFSRFPKIQNGLMDLHRDIALIKNKQWLGIMGIVISCLSQIIYALCWCFIAKALHQDMNIIYFLVFVPLTCIAASFPSIGGLGVREIAAVSLFGKIGMNDDIAASISIINFLFMVIVGLIGGLSYVFTLSSGRIQYHLPDTGADSREP